MIWGSNKSGTDFFFFEESTNVFKSETKKENCSSDVEDSNNACQNTLRQIYLLEYLYYVNIIHRECTMKIINR